MLLEPMEKNYKHYEIGMLESFINSYGKILWGRMNMHIDYVFCFAPFL